MINLSSLLYHGVLIGENEKMMHTFIKILQQEILPKKCVFFQGFASPSAGGDHECVR